jgi:hypothetical protein
LGGNPSLFPMSFENPKIFDSLYLKRFVNVDIYSYICDIKIEL